MPRFIPRKVFKVIAIPLLPLSVLIAGYWFVTDAGVYRIFVTLLGETGTYRGLGLLLTLLVNLIGVVVIAGTLRAFTRDMPALQTQIQNDEGLLKASGTLREKLDISIEQERQRGDQPAAKMQQMIISIAILTIGLAIGLVGLASFLITQDKIYEFQVVLLILGCGLFVRGCVGFIRCMKS